MQRKESEEERKYNFGILFFTVLNVLLLALIGITLYYVCTEKNVTVIRDSDICVPCEDLRLHPDDTITGVDRRGENKETCCVTDKDGSDALVEKFIDHWLKKKLATENREFTRYECRDNTKYVTRKPIIKLVGKSYIQKGHHKVLWDGKSDLAIDLQDERIKHYEKHGIIKIRIPGLYQVFSQIVFEHDMKDQDTDFHYHHSVSQESAGSADENRRQKSLLNMSNTICKSESDTQTRTSYMSGAVYLDKGDRIWVNVHNTSDIVPIPHMTFFGMYML